MKYSFSLVVLAVVLSVSGCESPDTNSGSAPAANIQPTIANTAPQLSKSPPATTPSPLPSPEPSAAAEAVALPVTLPVLDAFFADDAFASDLKTRLQLTDDEIRQLRKVAREATSKLNERSSTLNSGTTTAASAQASQSIKAIIGQDKALELIDFVRARWKGSEGGEGPTALAVSTAPGVEQRPNATPSDSRIVVNTPAYRMDVFEDGRLVKSYKVTIGYPEFPLPSGLRTASTIIFNPTWTPPDSPWVATMKNVTAGERVEAGSKLNPLGPIKIPIGLPSLIHGGKSPSKLGGFGSHGCVGLTNAQVQDFAKLLGEVGGTPLTDADIAGYAKHKSRTREVKLSKPAPVELRYETIVVEDGELHIYRDVYDKGTNTQDNLRNVLGSYGITFDQLAEKERTDVTKALKQMSRDAEGKPAGKAKHLDPESATVTRSVKGKKEIVVEIAELKGKGYPAPVNLDPAPPAKRGAPAKRNGTAPPGGDKHE